MFSLNQYHYFRSVNLDLDKHMLVSPFTGKMIVLFIYFNHLTAAY